MFVDFLGGPAVTFAYYLFTFFGILAALAIAWGQWHRSDSFRAYRLTIAFASLAILRLMFFALSAVASYSPEIANVWIPPFERVVSLASLGFLVWGFTPYFREKGFGFTGTILLVVNTVFAFIAYGVIVATWHGDNFNQSGWELFFVVWQTALVLFGAVNCALKLDDERAFALFSFVTLFFGFVLHMFSASAYAQPHNPVWVRIAELIAYPLFAVAVYQGAIYSLSARSRELQNLSEISIDQIKGLISLFEATREITSSLELSQVLDGATQSVAQALEADQTAIALPENEDGLSQLRLVSIYNPSRKGRGESVTFPTNDQQIIKHALKRKYQIRSDEYRDNRQIRMLFTLMGAHDVGPLIVQPFLRDEKPIGVLILGNAYSKRIFTDTEAELCKTIADQISVAIGHARDFIDVSAKAQQLSWTLRNHELDSGKRIAAMETELRKSREEVALFAQRLQQYETEQESKEESLDQARERIAKLERTLDRAKTEVERSKQKDKQIASLSAETEEYAKKIAELKTEREKLATKLEEFEQDTHEVKHLSEALAASNTRARKLARALKQARLRSQQAAPVPAALSSAEASPELEDLSCGVIITDHQQTISRVNPATSHMLNVSSKQLVGRNISQVVHDEHWQKALDQLRRGQDTATATFQMGEKVLRATISPMASESQDKEGLLTILYDITAEAESQRARDEFIASLSQELRTPMTSITGYTDLLVSESVGTIGEMQRKFLQRIKANIERMTVMLNDLIGVTAIDAGQLEIRPSVVDMAEIIEDTIIGARAQLEENELTVNMDIPEDMPPVEVDPDSVRQIMSNLLGNAIKSTPIGGSIGIATAIYEENGNLSVDPDHTPFLMVAIKDSGGGIAEKDLERVFERFYQAERPLIEGLGETGVGLSLVKSLVEAHGGRVWVESEIGEGSTFRFLLPISDQRNDNPWLEIDIPPLDLSQS